MPDPAARYAASSHGAARVHRAAVPRVDRQGEGRVRDHRPRGAPGRYHKDARKTFYGWADVWLDPGFKGWDIRGEFLPKVRCPVLAIQGHDDEYGTMEQLEEIRRRVGGPCELVKLERCGHAPFRDQAEQVLKKVAGFIQQLP
jgi:pimeloyl-ACP methyl ester carboxylesterase